MVIEIQSKRNTMKNSIFIAILALLLVTGCTNEPNNFDNYTTQAVYFPYQYPVRTLVLGESTIDNSIDIEHAFNIGVCIGGMYTNNKDWTVSIGMASQYMNYLNAYQITDANGSLTTVKILPSNYYSLVTNGDSTIVIPKGSFSGLMRVNLTDAFFNDSNSYKTLYVLPLKIKTASTDILSGVPALNSILRPFPNPLLITDWMAGYSPMNFTLFAVKYINPWHGTFFYRGKQEKNGVFDNTYHTQDIELNQTASIATAGYSKSLLKRMGTFVTSTNVLKMTFSAAVNGIGDISLSSADGSLLGVTGTGKYYKSTTDFAKDDRNTWLLNPVTGKKTSHLTMTLDYTVTGISAGNTYHFTDTLVMRDNAMTFQSFTPYSPLTLTGY